MRDRAALTDRRSFLGAVVALAAAPFVAKAEPTTPMMPPYEFTWTPTTLPCNVRISPEFPASPEDEDKLYRSAARLRAIRRLA